MQAYVNPFTGYKKVEMKIKIELKAYIIDEDDGSITAIESKAVGICQCGVSLIYTR